MPYTPYSRIITDPKTKVKKLKWKKLDRKCAVCRTKFDTHDPKKLYCSVKCRGREAERIRRNKRMAQNG